MTYNYKVYVPTYRRTFPECLKLLDKDNQLKLTFCIRKELVDEGFYSNLFELQNLYHYYGRIDFLILPNLNDIGDTREAILQDAIKNDIKYCVMIDDGIDSLVNVNNLNEPISKCVEDCCRRLEEDKFSKNCIMFEFYRKSRHYSTRPLDSKYFLEMPAQAYIINTQVAVNHNLHYHSKKEVGVEDEAFFIDTLKAGLITCSDSSYIIDGALPGVKKDGGNHRDFDYDEEEKNYDEFEKKRVAYSGDLYGVYLTKRYRRTLKCCTACTYFDFDYFYRVLVDKRKENQDIIESQFKVYQ